MNVAVGDVDADNYDDIIVSAGAGREAIITALSGRDIANGVADPERCFTFVAGGGAKEGVKVAVGYVAPSTVPSYKPNLITTPAARIAVSNSASNLKGAVDFAALLGPGPAFQSLSADGGVRCVSEGIAVELLQSLTSRAGGEVAAIP